MTEEAYHEASRQIIQKVMNSQIFKDADQILTYVSFGKEVSTRELIRKSLDTGKQVLVPKVIGKEMIFVAIQSLDELKPATMGILEPVSEEETLPSHPACMIMPGVAFDQEKHRIGYGGGYYDKYLEKYPELPTIAIAFEYQILGQIPTEATDISPQTIITERRILS